MNRLLGTEADDIVRTTEPRHRVAVQEIWRRMEARGDIYLSRYSGWYSVRDEAYHDAADLVDGPGRHAPRPDRHAGGVGGGGELVLPPLGLWRQAAGPLRRKTPIS